jgi:ElaB/YqjD/DUF883 family membrane-anchored ribosome-binding protein
MPKNFDDKRINEALELLNEVASEKKADLQEMISERYEHLKSALGGVAEKLHHEAQETYEQGREKMEEIASKVSGSVHKNPWPYLGGTALGFLILGFLFGRSRK